MEISKTDVDRHQKSHEKKRKKRDENHKKGGFRRERKSRREAKAAHAMDVEGGRWRWPRPHVRIPCACASRRRGGAAWDACVAELPRDATWFADADSSTRGVACERKSPSLEMHASRTCSFHAPALCCSNQTGICAYVSSKAESACALASKNYDCNPPFVAKTQCIDLPIASFDTNIPSVDHPHSISDRFEHRRTTCRVGVDSCLLREPRMIRSWTLGFANGPSHAFPTQLDSASLIFHWPALKWCQIRSLLNPRFSLLVYIHGSPTSTIVRRFPSHVETTDLRRPSEGSGVLLSLFSNGTAVLCARTSHVSVSHHALHQTKHERGIHQRHLLSHQGGLVDRRDLLRTFPIEPETLRV